MSGPHVFALARQLEHGVEVLGQARMRASSAMAFFQALAPGALLSGFLGACAQKSRLCDLLFGPAQLTFCAGRQRILARPGLGRESGRVLAFQLFEVMWFNPILQIPGFGLLARRVR